jgi:hypothetical protein
MGWASWVILAQNSWGIVTLWERFGENWNQQEPDVLSELFDAMEES